MIGQKNQIMRSAYYLIGLDRNSMSKKAPGYIGKLRSNLLKSEFSLFGEGEKPNNNLPLNEIRNEHAAIIYVRSIFSNSTFDQINVIIPQVIDERSYYIWKPLYVLMN